MEMPSIAPQLEALTSLELLERSFLCVISCEAIIRDSGSDTDVVRFEK